MLSRCFVASVASIFSKGRPWSPVEHLILQALANDPRTAAKLAEQSALPKRLVIEALIRLMRAGWVELSSQPVGTLFRATVDGRDKAFLDELPNVPKTITRWMTFVIDRVTGMTFRGRGAVNFRKTCRRTTSGKRKYRLVGGFVGDFTGRAKRRFLSLARGRRDDRRCGCNWRSPR